MMKKKLSICSPYLVTDKNLLLSLSTKSQGIGTKIKINLTKKTTQNQFINLKKEHSHLSHTDLLGNLHLA